MPTINVDPEQAALMEAAFAMLEAALTARVARADPDKIISNSLTLQANKLATVRALLKMPAPPAFSELDGPMRSKALSAMRAIVPEGNQKANDAAWEVIRGVINAAAFPAP